MMSAWSSGLVDAEAAGVFAVVLDAFEELGDEFFAHAGEGGELAGFSGGFEGVDVADLAGGPDEGYGLWAHAGEAEEIEHGGLVFEEELFAEGHGAGGDEGDDVGGHAFADAGDGEESFGVGVGLGEGAELSGLLFYGFGGAAIGADAEGVGAVDFEEGGGFVEETGDGDVVHRRESEAGASPPAFSMPDSGLDGIFATRQLVGSEPRQAQVGRVVMKGGSRGQTASLMRETWSAWGPLAP